VTAPDSPGVLGCRVPRIHCNACGHVVDVVPAETYVCPSCGEARGLHIEVDISDNVGIHDTASIKGKDEQGKEFLDSKVGDSYFRKDDEWHEIEQTVNRKTRRYRKKIVRKATGEVLRDEDVPLDQHEPTAVKRRRESGHPE
jgi:hypothetical protein